MASIPAETPKTRVPLPPTNARVVTTACEYCPVACGYKAYIWPVGAEGDPRAAENALDVDFPAPALSGRWPSPNMHTNVTIVGQLQNVLVMPDPDADVVNVGGNHSVSGGTLAPKLYRPDGPTRDRLQRPLLRVNGTLQPIAWEAATDIVAEMIRYAIDEFGELAMGFKSARTGVPAESIRRAAELLARSVDGVTPKASLLYEKGLYWTHNYENTAAMGNLSVLIGARGRPGRATSRMGGHQHGGASGAPYPFEKSPTEFEGQKVEMDTDRWTTEGKTRMVWAIGNDWVNGSGASNFLGGGSRDDARDGAAADVDGAGQGAAAAQAATRQRGHVHRPERDLSERQFRVCGSCPPRPGASRMSAATTPSGGCVSTARSWTRRGRRSRTGRSWRRWPARWASRASTGRTPTRSSRPPAPAPAVARTTASWWSSRRPTAAAHTTSFARSAQPGSRRRSRSRKGNLQGTVRLHTDMKFKGSNGKSNFVFVDLDAIRDRNDLLGPNSNEFWVLSGRVNRLWQSLYDDKRKPHLIQRYPVSFSEINPQDAERLGIAVGELVAVESDRVRTQQGTLESSGCTAVAYVTDTVQPGNIFAVFHYPWSPANAVVTVDASTPPSNPRQPFTFGRGRVTRIGATNLPDVMPFAPRNIA